LVRVFFDRGLFCVWSIHVGGLQDGDGDGDGDGEG
jgi:hypothetical protein